MDQNGEPQGEPIRIPVEISSPSPIFNVVAKGYDRAQVDEHLFNLAQEMAELKWQHEFWQSQRDVIERDRTQLEEERAAFLADRDSWEPSFALLGDRAQQILRMAQAEADALRERTTADCEAERSSAEAEMTEWRSTFDRQKAESIAELRQELEHMRLEADDKAAHVMHSAHTKADALLEESRHKAEAIELRANNDLSAARQERHKIAQQLAELVDRIQASSHWLAEDTRLRHAPTKPESDYQGTEPAHKTAHQLVDENDQGLEPTGCVRVIPITAGDADGEQAAS